MREKPRRCENVEVIADSARFYRSKQDNWRTMQESAKGRKPPEYTQEQLDLAIELASNGKPLKDIIGQICSSEYEFWMYRQHNPNWANLFEHARQEGLEHIADGLITIADEMVDVQRARLKSDNAKWLLSKRKPSVYGDKVDIHVSQTIDIGSALAEARKRALPTAEDPQLIDVTPALAQGMPKK
jgi:hypothetical protein